MLPALPFKLFCLRKIMRVSHLKMHLGSVFALKTLFEILFMASIIMLFACFTVLALAKASNALLDLKNRF